MKFTTLVLTAAGVSLGVSSASAAPKVTSAYGLTPADLAPAVAAFRADIGLGGAANAANGPFATGFRNINWDGTAEAAVTPNAMPADFFNSNVRRGAVFTTPTPGAAVQVSAATGNPAGIAVRFGNIEPSYATRFKAFTEQRLFAAVGSTTIDATFFVPGTPNTRATVNGFGAVFCDVDLANVSAIECFDESGRSLGKYYAPVANDGLSFVGVFFPEGERVARVRLTLGNLPLAAGNVDTATADVVATDDFMFGEPLPLVTDAKLLNLSVRGAIGAGANSLIAGFVVGGTQPKSVLVRAVGPGLAAFGVPGTVANPSLSVVNAAGQTLAANDDWGNAATLAQAASEVGAFPLTTGSADAAAIVVLNPGAYSLQVTGAAGTSGVTLAEIYEIR